MEDTQFFRCIWTKNNEIVAYDIQYTNYCQLYDSLNCLMWTLLIAADLPITKSKKVE